MYRPSPLGARVEYGVLQVDEGPSFGQPSR